MQVSFNHLYQEYWRFTLCCCFFSYKNNNKQMYLEKKKKREEHSRHKWIYARSASDNFVRILPSSTEQSRIFLFPLATDLNSPGNKDWIDPEIKHGKLGIKMYKVGLNSPAAWVHWLCIPAPIVYTFTGLLHIKPRIFVFIISHPQSEITMCTLTHCFAQQCTLYIFLSQLQHLSYFQAPNSSSYLQS